MNRKLTVKIKKRSQPGWLCWLLIVLPFLFGTLNMLLGLPWGIRYTLDVAWLLLIVIMVRFRDCLSFKNTRALTAWTGLFLAYTLLVYMVRYQNGLYYLWGVRNHFRFFAAFFAFAAFLSRRDVEGYFRLFDSLFWINVAVSLVQFFLLGKSADHLGGIFGVTTGGNGYTNVFFCIILTKSLIFYLNKKEKLSACAGKFIAAMVVAALAELKFFFVEAVLIVILAVLFTDFSWRKVQVVAGGFALILTGAMLLVYVFPGYAGFFSWQWMWENAVAGKGYTSSGDLNRLNAIPMINEYFLDNGWKRLFGLGMGNCETSTFAFLNTPFFEKYSWLHYSWISYAFLYLECGGIGLMFYFGFFALVCLQAHRIEKTCGASVKGYCAIAKIMAILCAVIAVYNASLRAESAYMAFFAMAAPFAAAKQESCEEKQ